MEFNVESPFSFDLGDELFPLPTLSCTDNIDIPLPQLPLISPTLDLNSNNNNNNHNSVSKKPKNNGRRKKPSAPASTSNDVITGDIESPNEQKKKKIIHRDVERQRRQEMSSLYSDLRSLIPLEYLKGKRSICDHMEEAVKYIRYMQSKIQQLSDNRDNLKNQLSDQNPVAGMVETLNSSKKDSVMVRPTNEPGGVQVVLNTATQHRLPVSTILQALIANGLEILSCISTKVNHRFIHTIQAQAVVVVVDYDHINPSIDVVELQHKLTNLEYTPLD